MKLKGIAPCLWFDSDAEEAAKFYVRVFKKNSKIETVARYGDVGQEVHGRRPGSVSTVSFLLAGQRFIALNGGPAFKFSEAISLMVFCDTQKEIGLSWQVTPTALLEMIRDRNRAKADRAFGAMMEMKKLDIAALKKAYAGK